MTTESISRETVLEYIKALPEADGRWVVESFIWGSSKAKGSRKRDPDAPKREVKPDSYFHLTNKVVWPMMKAYIEANSEELGEERVKELKGVSARTQVSKLIWDDIKAMDSEARVTLMEGIDEARVMAALKSWLATPPEMRTKAKDNSSTASGDSKKSKKTADMTEEEKKAAYKARAAKAAATKAAKKAAAAAASATEEPSNAAGGGPSLPAADDEVEMEDEATSVQPTPWEHDFGKGTKMYGSIDLNGVKYVFDTKGALLGAFNAETNKLKKVKEAENPFA